MYIHTYIYISKLFNGRIYHDFPVEDNRSVPGVPIVPRNIAYERPGAGHSELRREFPNPLIDETHETHETHGKNMICFTVENIDLGEDEAIAIQ